MWGNLSTACVLWPFNHHIKTAQQRTITAIGYSDCYTGRWWVGCYIWYSEKGTGRGCSPPRPLLAVPNVTAHSSTASVPTSYYSMWHYAFGVWRVTETWRYTLKHIVLKMLFLMQVLLVLLGLIYFNQSYDQKGVMNINGCLFLMQMMVTIGNTITVLNVSSTSLLFYMCNYSRKYLFKSNA